MVTTCHMCGSEVALNGDSAPDAEEGFECADCGRPTCDGCKSIGVGRDSNHCRICRG